MSRGLSAHPEPLQARLIRVELESGEVEVLITSLLDAQAYPHRLFAKLYALRWGVEENYKREKQRLEIENFSGRPPLGAAAGLSRQALCAEPDGHSGMPGTMVGR